MRPKTILMTLAVVAIGGYAILTTSRYFSGAELIISYPTDGALLQEELLVIEGVAHGVAHLSIGGSKVFTDDAGRFTHKLLLPHGYSIIEVRALDRFDRETLVRRELVYRPAG